MPENLIEMYINSLAAKYLLPQINIIYRI